MKAARPVSTRAVVSGIALGSVSVAALFAALPADSELPDVEVLQRLDLPIAAAALVAWMAAALLLAPTRSFARLGLPLALLLAVAPVMAGSLLLPTPVSNDERAYLLQAEMFAAGRLSAPLVEPAEALRRRQIHEDPVRGTIYAKYPPGTALALLPGTLVGLPAAAVAVAGCLAVWLVAAISRRLGVADPGVAALLFASCPLFTLLQASLQSQVFTLPAALAGYLALLHARAGGGRVFVAGLALGACAGWIFLARPLTGVVFAAAMTPGLWLRGSERPASGLRALSGALLGGLPFLVALLAYDRALTGSAWLTPYALYAAEFSPWDVYPLFRSAFFEEPWTAVLQNLSRQLVRWTPALFGVLGAAGLGFWGLWRLRARDGGAGLAFAVALPCAYALHWYPGHWAVLGPIYASESLGLLVVAAALLLDAAPPGWRRSLPPIALAAGTALFVHRFELVEEQARLRFAPEAVVAAAKLEREAVVLLPRYHQPDRHERSLNLYTPTRPPLDGPVVYLRQFDSVARTRAAIEAFGLADRTVYRFVPDDSGQGGRLELFEP